MWWGVGDGEEGVDVVMVGVVLVVTFIINN